MDAFMNFLNDVNGVIWADWVLYVVLGVGVLFTLWTGFCQYRALTHGVAVTTGRYDEKDDPGAINHFQALSAALSATVGLGNIGGVAVAIALGGPGAVFWMWMVGIFGMALKTTEVCLSMMYRNTDEKDNPHGGPMYVAQKGFEAWGLKGIGTAIGMIFCVTLLISAITGGNMFQAWNVGVQTEEALGVPSVLVGIILAIVVGSVIIGGIKRIGHVAGVLVPFMCALYFISGLVVIGMNIAEIPGMFGLIFRSAFSASEATGAFVGGTAGYAFLWGMKRALFSSEAGQGSSPIAHSAAKTNEPVRESVVAGIEPFIDTIVVCTLTALVILSTGAWNRGAAGEAIFQTPPAINSIVIDHDADATTPDVPATVFGAAHTFPGDTDPVWASRLPAKTDEALRVTQKEWADGDNVFMIAHAEDADQSDSGTDLVRVPGEVRVIGEGEGEAETRARWVVWAPIPNEASTVSIVTGDVYKDYPGATLTAHAFDRAIPGFGTWMVLIASWLFAISTMISWSYYGEQGIIFMVGKAGVLPYKLIYCLLAVVATVGFIETDAELDALTALGTGVMLWANIPIMLIFGATAMAAWHGYFRRFKAGEFHPHGARSLEEMIDE